MKKLLIPLLAVAAVLSLALSCGQSQQSAEKQSEADSLLRTAADAMDNERVIVLTDSLEQTGNISPFRSAFYRGRSYKNLGDFRHTEEVVKPVMDMTPTTSQDSAYYGAPGFFRG